MADPRTPWINALMASEGDSVDSYAVAVAFALYAHMDRTGSCRPSVRRLARMARCSPKVVVDRISRLEAAGLLGVVRRPKAVSAYTAICPSVSSQATDPNCASVSPETTDICASVVPQNESVSPGETEPIEPSNHTSSEPVTHEPAGAEAKPQKITPTRIFTEMARRRLMVGRRENFDWAPPTGCDPRREQGWLKAQADAFKTQHGFKLDTMLARYYRSEGGPDKYRDPDWYVWHLDPDLAKRDWLMPTAEESRAKREQERAEREARLAAMTPEDREADARARDEARARIAAIRQRTDQERHLTLVAVEAS